MTKNLRLLHPSIVWTQRAWRRLYEPRIVSAAYGAAYITAAILGGLSAFNPPGTIENVAGPTLMAIIAGAIACGGVLGAVTVALGLYWAERTAVHITSIGLLGYLAMTLYLQFTSSGQRGMTLLAIVLALILMGVRFYWIGARPYNPRTRITAERRTDTEP